MIRVCHLAYIYGTNNTGGAAIAATRLHRELLATGVDSHYICVKQYESGKNVYQLPYGVKRKLFFFASRILRGIWKLTRYGKAIPLNIVPLFGLNALLEKLHPDIVHIQWINADVASFEQLSRLPYKCIFNLHDLFIINAMDAYPFSDMRFITGFDKENSAWLERFLFDRKKRMIERLNPSFIGPSKWVCEQSRTSLIGRNRNADAIPNIIDDAYFENLSLSTANSLRGCFVIMFGAFGGRRNTTKGFDDLSTALDLLPVEMKQACELRIYGEEAEPCETSGIHTIFLGNIDNVATMIQELSKADVFAFPSKAETQGMTKVEALLCGIPVVTFDRTACAEGIEHGFNGWIAKDGDIQSFASGLHYYFHCWQLGYLDKLKQSMMNYARAEYNIKSIINRTIALYNTISHT